MAASSSRQGSASQPSSANDQVDSVLPSFLAVLRSDAPITLPAETLYGAITHFLSTLPHPHLRDFVQAVVLSPRLWDMPSGAREAVQLSVPAKLTQLNERRRWFAEWRTAREAASWAGTVVEEVIAAKESSGRTQFLAGILEGMEATPRVWGHAKTRAEEEVVLALATDDGFSHLEERLQLFAEVAGCIDEKRLRALDLGTYLPTIEDRLFQILASENATDQASSRARALGRLFGVMENGEPQMRRCAWEKMFVFCSRMREFAETQRGWRAEGADDAAFERGKTALFSFLLPSLAVLDILLADPEPPQLPSSSLRPLHPSAQLSLDVLLTLATFASIIEQAEGGFEGYHRVLYGALDVLVAKSGPNGVRRLFEHAPRDMSASEATWWLTAAESVVNELDGWCVREIVFPLCSKRIRETSHRRSFEAAHSTLLSLLTAASQSLEKDSTQGAFVEEIGPVYASLVLRQARQGDITLDQLRSAYPLIVAAVVRASPSTLVSVINLLSSPSVVPTTSPSPSTSVPEEHAWAHTTLLTRLAISPYVPTPQLRRHLDALAEEILTVPRDSPKRVEFAGAAFKVVMEDLGDDQRGIGMEWWADHRDDLESGTRQRVERARL